MKRLLNKLFGTTATKTKTGRNKSFKPQIEALEDRKLMAAFIGIGGQLVIDGLDSRHDQVTVSTRYSYNKVSGPLTSATQLGSYNFQGGSQQVVVDMAGEGSYVFSRSAINSIMFLGRGGNDFFRNDTNLPSFALGGTGDDTLIGGSVADALEGQWGNDRLEGRAGNDDLLGGTDNDTYIFGSGGSQGWDWVVENFEEGVDTLDFSACALGVAVNLGNTGQQTVNSEILFELRGTTGESAIENVIGSNLADIIIGNSRKNTLVGLAGTDNIDGRTGNDSIFGNADGDTLIGGEGNDMLDGGTGADNLFGEADHDDLIGGEGMDTLSGGSGKDYLIGDTHEGGNDGSQDSLDGGADFDFLCENGLLLEQPIFSFKADSRSDYALGVVEGWFASRGHAGA